MLPELILMIAKERINWFLGMTMGASIGLHLILFWIFSSVPLFPPLVVSDLAFQDLSEPPARSIPRPRPTARELTNLDDIKEIKSLKVAAVPLVGAVRTDSPSRSQGTGIAGIAGDHLARAQRGAHDGVVYR